MIKTLSALAIVTLISTPAFAEGGGENNSRGLPQVSQYGTIAAGQPDYVVDSAGHWVDAQKLKERQLATTPKKDGQPEEIN